MTSKESIRSKYGSTAAMAVGGLMANPTFLPRERIFQIKFVTWPSSSTCTVIRSAPGAGTSRVGLHIYAVSRLPGHVRYCRELRGIDDLRLPTGECVRNALRRGCCS